MKDTLDIALNKRLKAKFFTAGEFVENFAIDTQPDH